MKSLFRISNNSSYQPRMAVIYEITQGLLHLGLCPACGVERRQPSGDLNVVVHAERRMVWPDLMACGDYPCFVASEAFKNAMWDCGIEIAWGGTVTVDVLGEAPPPPQYYWVDGTRNVGGKMDFEASGHVGTKFCPECGTRSEDISASYDKKNYSDPPPGIVIDYDEKAGLDLFTTDLSPTAFFCTERVLECVRRHKLVSVSICRVEDGVNGKALKI